MLDKLSARTIIMVNHQIRDYLFHFHLIFLFFFLPLAFKIHPTASSEHCRRTRNINETTTVLLRSTNKSEALKGLSLKKAKRKNQER